MPYVGKERLRTQTIQVVDRPRNLVGTELPAGPWTQPPDAAAVLPIPPTGETGRAGVLVVGLNPFRLFDDNYRAFLGLVAGQIAAAIANARAYEEERRRAEALAAIDRATSAIGQTDGWSTSIVSGAAGCPRSIPAVHSSLTVAPSGSAI